MPPWVWVLWRLALTWVVVSGPVIAWGAASRARYVILRRFHASTWGWLTMAAALAMAD